MIVIGIDLGTSNSTLSYFDKNNVFHIIEDNGSHNIASIVSITKHGNIFGNKAKNIKDNNFFISNIKRLIGYKYNDLHQSYYDQFNGITIINNNGDIGIVVDTKVYSPDEIMVYFLNYLKQLINLEANIIGEQYKVIVTVPAYFNIQQKEAINNCILVSGFDLIKLLSEPVSASIAYGNFVSYNNDDNILIFDLGGGTLDLSIINICSDNGEKAYEVKGTYGDNKFGGSDLTYIIIDYIKTKYPDYNITNNNLFEHIDNLKIKLSSGYAQETIIINENSITIQEEEWQFLVDLWLNNIEISLQQVLDIAQLSISDINSILLVGGSSKILQITKKLSVFFNCDIKQYYMDNIPLQDIAVSYGAALHGNILYSTKDLILIDVCPFTIGIETTNNIMVPIIERNSQIPISRTKQFTTDEDYTSQVKIKIFQGESKLTTNNIFIGEFVLDGIQETIKGVPVINVNISINSNGLLRVVAADRKNFSRNEIIISANDYKLSDKQIETIKYNMTTNKHNEDILFNLIEQYNIFIIDFERLVYNLIINPVSKFHQSYIDNIKNEIINQLFEIHFIINDNTFSDLISFQKFIFFFNALYSENDLKIERKNKDYNNIYIYLKLLFQNLKSFLFDKYQNLLMTFDNDSIEGSLPKKKKSQNTESENFISQSSIYNKTSQKYSSFNEINDVEPLTEQSIQKNELITLIDTLLKELGELPINNIGKQLLKEYIDNISTDNFDDYLIKITIDKINDYCKIIFNNYSL